MYQNSPSLLWELLLLRDVVGLVGTRGRGGEGEGRGDLDHAMCPTSYSSRHRRPCALLPGLGPSSLLGGVGENLGLKAEKKQGLREVTWDFRGCRWEVGKPMASARPHLLPEGTALGLASAG